MAKKKATETFGSSREYKSLRGLNNTLLLLGNRCWKPQSGMLTSFNLSDYFCNQYDGKYLNCCSTQHKCAPYVFKG